MRKIESLNDVCFKGKTLTSITGIGKSTTEKGIYIASYSEKKEKLSDVTNHYKVYWDLNEFFEKELRQEFDWDTPHSIHVIGNIKEEKREIELNIDYISNFPAYNKKVESCNGEIEILHRPIELYPNLQDIIYWALAKDSNDEYYKVYWNVINLYKPYKIEMTTDYSRYCKKCLKVWTNTEKSCIDEFGHEYVLNTSLENVMGVDEAADLWKLAPGTIKNYCAEEKIVAKKIGKTWVIDKNQKNPSQLKNESDDSKE